jgi:hypothetical protein
LLSKVCLGEQGRAATYEQDDTGEEESELFHLE